MDSLNIWKSQATNKIRAPRMKLSRPFTYSNDSKIIGDGLSVVDIYLRSLNLSSCNIISTNVLVSWSDAVWSHDPEVLVTSVPAWADPATALQETYFTPELFVPTSKHRIIVATTLEDTDRILACIHKSLSNIKYVMSDYYLDAQFYNLPPMNLRTQQEMPVKKSDLINSWLDHVQSNSISAMLIWITRAYPDTSQSLDLLDPAQGLLNIDKVRIYGFRPFGWNVEGKNYSDISNRLLLAELLSELSSVDVCFSNKQTSRMYTCNDPASLKNFFTLQAANITYRVVLNGRYQYEMVVPHVALHSEKSQYLPLDSIWMYNQKSKGALASLASAVGYNPTESVQSQTLLDGYPIFAIRPDMDFETLPPHLRGLAVSILDSNCKNEPIKQPLKILHSPDFGPN